MVPTATSSGPTTRKRQGFESRAVASADRQQFSLRSVACTSERETNQQPCGPSPKLSISLSETSAIHPQEQRTSCFSLHSVSSTNMNGISYEIDTGTRGRGSPSLKRVRICTDLRTRRSKETQKKIRRNV